MTIRPVLKLSKSSRSSCTNRAVAVPLDSIPKIAKQRGAYWRGGGRGGGRARGGRSGRGSRGGRAVCRCPSRRGMLKLLNSVAMPTGCEEDGSSLHRLEEPLAHTGADCRTSHQDAKDPRTSRWHCDVLPRCSRCRILLIVAVSRSLVSNKRTRPQAKGTHARTCAA